MMGKGGGGWVGGSRVKEMMGKGVDGWERVGEMGICG